MRLNFKRLFCHLLATPGQLKRAFPHATLAAIEQAIRSSEAEHAGEIRFAVEAGLSGHPLYHDQSARERAIDVFSQLRMWDTEHRNGVLIYLLLADHAVEIIADRGVNTKVGTAVWQHICVRVDAAFREGHFESGILEGISEVSALLCHHFPESGIGKNELPDRVVVL